MSAISVSGRRGRDVQGGHAGRFDRDPPLGRAATTALGQRLGVQPHPAWIHPKLVDHLIDLGVKPITGKPGKPATQGKNERFHQVERRHDTGSTVFCTQYAKKDWHPRLGSGVRADAIMDRIVHNAIWIDTGTKNMHEHHALNQ